jgi:hypothetical protein
MSKELSKEEILNRYDSSRKYIEQTCRPELFKAMDEYAQQEAIGFEIWKNREGWMFSSNPLWEPNVRVYFQPNEETDWLSLEELYNLYKQSKEKQP